MGILAVILSLGSVFLVVLLILAWWIIYITRKLAKLRAEYVGLEKQHAKLHDHHHQVTLCYSALRNLTHLFLSAHPFEAHEKPLVKWVEDSLDGTCESVEEDNTLHTLCGVRDRLQQRKEMTELKQQLLEAEEKESSG